MYNFFITPENILDNKATISGKDYNHILNVLRLKVGDQILISANDKSHLCKIDSFDEISVFCEIIEKDYQDTNLPIEIYLFQGLPKSDKMELIIQKAVELGAHAVIPVQTERSVVKIEPKKIKAKTERWQAIAESAGKQSKRTSIPKIYDTLSFTDALDKAKTLDLFILPYENAHGMQDTKDALSKIKSGMKVGVMIGSEGGFSQKEIDLALTIGAKTISLGKRILRTETASITALSMLMLYAETFL